MTFKKLALVSAIALAPTAGFSVDLLGDDSLSDVTGQDGLLVSVATPTAGIQGDIYIHDTDGIPGSIVAGYSNAGAIVIDDFAFVGNLDIEIDAGDAAVNTSAPTLNILVSIPSASLSTGAISVANSERDDGTPGWGVGSATGPLLNSMDIALTQVTMNIQLGNEPQGNMIALDTSIVGGLTISNFALNDVGGTPTYSGGSIGAAVTEIVGAGGAALDVVMGINANADGLMIEIGTLGSSTGIDMQIEGAYLGSDPNTTVGDMTIRGLNLNGSVITVSGK